MRLEESAVLLGIQKDRKNIVPAIEGQLDQRSVCRESRSVDMRDGVLNLHGW